MPHRTPLRIGTRASQLALIQANWVAERLTRLGQQVELVHVTTDGDKSSSSLTESGGRGLFTKSIQTALLRKDVDLAVHSLKDLPTEAVPGVELVASPPRAAVEDVLVTLDGTQLEQLPAGCRVGTGSLRRRAQLLHLRPDLMVLDVRGNVDTRLDKLRRGEYDALVLAAAGLQRLGLLDQRWQILDCHQMLPAVGQGALGLEIRMDDRATAACLAELNDDATWAAVQAERGLLERLTAGCLAPVGAWARIAKANRLRLDAVVLSADGRQRLERSADDEPTRAASLGQQLADQLLDDGALQLIEQHRG